MRKNIFLLIVLSFVGLFSSLSLQAQKFGFIDANFILMKMPAYQKAQDEITGFSQKAEKLIEQKTREVADLRTRYVAEEMLMTNEMKADRLKAIDKREFEVKELQQKTFGFEGLLFYKKQELLAPIRDELNKALEKVAKKKGLAAIYDKSGDFIVLYLDPTHDYTDFVLEALGLGDKDDNPKENSNKK